MSKQQLKVGVANEETWGFFSDIYSDMQIHFDTQVFNPRKFTLPIFNVRVNKWLLQEDLRQFIQQNDVVFFEWSSRLLASASHLKKNGKVITRLHRYELYNWADQINWDFVDKIILVSKAKQQEFIQRFPQYTDKTMVIPVSVDLNKFSLHQRKFNKDIGILCHLRPRKRVYDLILAFYELLQHDEDFHLHIGGGKIDGVTEYHQALKTLVSKLNLQNKVTFYGHIANPEDWYHQIDIFISNSYSEGLQVSPMEAIACGCYCLSHHWDGADELLPAGNLYFTERQLVDQILNYAQLSEAEKQTSRTQMRSIAVENFDITRSISQIRELIYELGASQR